MTVFLKDPDAILDYTVNWNDGYLETDSPAEVISTSEWFIEPAPPSPPGQALQITGTPTKTATTATAFVTGGEVGRVYRLTNRIVTDRGRTDDRAVIIRVEAK